MNWKEADLNSAQFEVLRETEVDPPIEKLYYDGIWPDLENSIAVVGSRKVSEYGKKICREFVKVLAESGITIISGFMYGLDTEAHNAAIRAGGKTVGVLGYGANFLPKYGYAYDLYKRVLETKSGVVVSEYEPDEQAAQWTFPKRNRIIAGLSKATLIVEAAENSGSLITAGYAIEQGKDVFALPGSIYSSNSNGTNWLIKQGAAVATSPEDILMYFGKSSESKIVQVTG